MGAMGVAVMTDCLGQSVTTLSMYPVKPHFVRVNDYDLRGQSRNFTLPPNDNCNYIPGIIQYKQAC